MKVFVSWSGGKDCMLACYRVLQQPQTEVAFLLNMLTEDGTHSLSHNLPADLIQEQARKMVPIPINRSEAEIGAIPTTLHQKKVKAGMEVSIMQRRASRKDYEKEFKAAISELKQQGVEAGVFGDIDLQVHRDWIERVCKEMEIKAIFPLWEDKREDLLEEFIAAGFKSRIVVTDAATLGEEWLGREIDREFMSTIKNLPHVDACGEKGEYHTFVYDGPVFREPVPFYDEEHRMIENHWVLKMGSGLRQEIRK